MTDVRINEVRQQAVEQTRKSQRVSRNLTRQCLRCNKQLTSDDLTELGQVLVDSSGQQVNVAWATERGGGLGVFVRNLAGFNLAAAAEAFESYLGGKVSTDQVRFMSLIVDPLQNIKPTVVFRKSHDGTP